MSLARPLVFVLRFTGWVLLGTFLAVLAPWIVLAWVLIRLVRIPPLTIDQ